MAKNRATKRPHGRLGRPPKDLAGDVKSRILDAAQRVFLKKGYQSASMDEIAELAPASKPTIYSYFPGKEALFAAVVAGVINGLTGFEGYTPDGRTVQDKLTESGYGACRTIYQRYRRRYSRHDCRSGQIPYVEPTSP